MQKLTSFVAFFALLLACAGANPMIGQSKLINLMQSTSELQQDNPTRSLECFQYYSGVFDAHLKTYETEYAECQNKSQAELESINKGYTGILNSLNNSVVESCEAVIDCRSLPDAMQSLNCYTIAGTSNTKEMYNVYTNATNSRAQLVQQIQLVQFNEELCSNKTKHTYEINTDETYIDLQNCLKGETQIPSTTVIRAASSPMTTELVSQTTTKAGKNGLKGEINNIINKLEHLL